MKTIFENCTPRDEVLRGDLRDEMFAARLKDVVEGSADPLYSTARAFFENTYPTEGLKTLVNEVLGRLNGHNPTASPFIRLETSFGGGKTHNLIALYHLAQGHSDGLPAGILPPDWIPAAPLPTAGIAGWEMDPANRINHGEVSTRTLWGEIAWHLGRGRGDATAAYELIRQSDEQLVAPGAQVLDRLIGDGPALIMLDEVARYLRAASAVPTAGGQSTLAEQTVAFLMTLIEFAATKPRVVVVLTLADSSDAFGKETDQLKGKLAPAKATKPRESHDLAEARRISARQERVLTPAGETEIARIVTHRLFRRVEPPARPSRPRSTRTASASWRRRGSTSPPAPCRPSTSRRWRGATRSIPSCSTRSPARPRPSRTSSARAVLSVCSPASSAGSGSSIRPTPGTSRRTTSISAWTRSSPI
ncbi:MAG: DUF499 domain-containing protein [Deltaproteobacteria bacterium]|nr:DUF499 domain-containing protein [Deltaproteobacteria bacterium]